MSNAAKVHEFLNKAQVFYFLTTDGDQPKGRPFGLQMLLNDTIYFGCGTFKNVFKQLTANPKVEVLALCGNEFMRYDGTAKMTSDAAVLGKVRETFPQIMALYDQKGWEKQEMLATIRETREQLRAHLNEFPKRGGEGSILNR